MKGTQWEGAQSSEREEQLCEHTVDRKYLGEILAEMSKRVGGRDRQEAELHVAGLGDPLRDFKKGITWTDCILGSSFSLPETEPAGLGRPIRIFATVCVRPGRQPWRGGSLVWAGYEAAVRPGRRRNRGEWTVHSGNSRKGSGQRRRQRK